ncbi:MAG: aldo/keto reductase [Trueperaceae bacterium]|nr:aldo/keto reductase [Trueperaceae bacterium]
MIRRRIQGATVPALGLGTWELRGDACTRAVEHALALGYRHIDTAQGYDNEAEVGTGLRRSGVPREEVFLTTKVRPRHFRRDDLLRSTEASLAALGVDVVDLLLLHWPNPEVPLEETLLALHEARERGLTRHVGVSNFPPSLLLRALAAGPTLTDQVEYHPFLAQGKLLALAEAHDLLLTAYAPVARGRVLDDPTLRDIGARHGKGPAQVALRWLLQQPRVVAIPKAASPENRAANLDVFDFELDDEEMRRIFGLASGKRLVDDPRVDWED